MWLWKTQSGKRLNIPWSGDERVESKWDTKEKRSAVFWMQFLYRGMQDKTLNCLQRALTKQRAGLCPCCEGAHQGMKSQSTDFKIKSDRAALSQRWWAGSRSQVSIKLIHPPITKVREIAPSSLFVNAALLGDKLFPLNPSFTPLTPARFQEKLTKTFFKISL